jgi:hypothetical protein
MCLPRTWCRAFPVAIEHVECVLGFVRYSGVCNRRNIESDSRRMHVMKPKGQALLGLYEPRMSVSLAVPPVVLRCLTYITRRAAR